MEGSHWRKSSFSGNTAGNCVELGQGRGAVLVRDTKDHGHGPMLRVNPDDWQRFTSSIKQA
jgi:hypothetical protein